MRRSVIPQAEGSRFVKLRPDLVAACEGNVCAALLLDVFDFRAAQDANGFTETPWVRASIPWLSEWLGGGFGERALRTALGELEERGFIESRTNPERKLDRTKEYRLRPDAVGSCIPAIAGMEPDDRSPHARVSDGVEEPSREEQRHEDPFVAEVWAYWLERRPSRRTELAAGTAKQIARARNSGFAVDELKRAIDGLLASDFHQEKGLLRLSTIFKTGPGTETFEDRIQGFIDRAPGSRRQPQPTLGPALRQSLTNARDYGRVWDGENWRFPEHQRGFNARVDAALRAIAEQGFRLVWAGEDHKQITFEEIDR